MSTPGATDRIQAPLCPTRPASIRWPSEQQARALEILQFKLDVLWSMLDAMYLAYVLEMPPYFSVDQSP